MIKTLQDQLQLSVAAVRWVDALLTVASTLHAGSEVRVPETK